MILGVTGSSWRVTDAQHSVLRTRLPLWATPDEVPVLHHGDCIHADAYAAQHARDFGYYIIGHPPTNQSKRAFFESDSMNPEKPYLERNHDIVDACEALIAIPDGFIEELRSGTWATVRYARQRHRPIFIVYPDGRTRTEGPWK